MIDIRAVEDLLNAELRVAALVGAYERDEPAFCEDVRRWLSDVEQKMIASRFPFASELSVLRGGIVAAERGVVPTDITFGRHATSRKIRTATAFQALRKAEEILRTMIKPLALQIGEGEQLVRQIFSLAEQKAIVPPAPDADELWRSIEEHPELRAPAAHAVALLGRTNVRILMMRILAAQLR